VRKSYVVKLILKDIGPLIIFKENPFARPLAPSVYTRVFNVDLQKIEYRKCHITTCTVAVIGTFQVMGIKKIKESFPELTGTVQGMTGRAVIEMTNKIID
jgi:invasion protein IalB